MNGKLTPGRRPEARLARMGRVSRNEGGNQSFVAIDLALHPDDLYR